jgi:thiamine biosynthesis lipoprotein
MGTRYNVSIVGGTEENAERLQKLVEEVLAELNRQMSTYDPQSELSRFNASKSYEWFAVSPATASVTASALELAEATGGKFDPTVGPLANLWGFGPGKKREAPPMDEEIATAKESVGYKLLEARLDPPALRKHKPSVYVELSAIAAGHGADAIAEMLAAEGVDSFMVDVGGELHARGMKPGNKPWRIGIERADTSLPVGPKAPLQGVIELHNKSLATSGDYRNFFEVDGKRFSHVIDPLTGRPVDHDLATVTVLADTSRDADALGTALLVLGPTEGYDWAVEHDVAALMVSRTPDDKLVERTTPAWNAEFSEQTAEGKSLGDTP